MNWGGVGLSLSCIGMMECSLQRGGRTLFALGIWFLESLFMVRSVLLYSSNAVTDQTAGRIIQVCPKTLNLILFYILTPSPNPRLLALIAAGLSFSLTLDLDLDLDLIGEMRPPRGGGRGGGGGFMGEE
ncbi:uncharacterized protein LOC120261407 [Dioscorea cayenensis subsp. rotundata]|uniref:Uncharacterized protein LOC120261407 n=1 Tax=Dioscorea cayennensis subsp. rotundata TaxID=55577 RepID=A0AB40BDE2_DIOCR|nr:uncharacterized protein LOC120261407 [Dioscorea cayenensis subsp. rotundata]